MWPLTDMEKRDPVSRQTLIDLSHSKSNAESKMPIAPYKTVFIARAGVIRESFAKRTPDAPTLRKS